MAVDSAFGKMASIIGQPVRTGRKTAGTGAGTVVPKSYGSTQGMKPADFRAFKATVNQKVSGDVYGHGKDWVLKPEPAERKSRTKGEQGDADTKFIETARKRFTVASDAEAKIRKEALNDLKFLSGDQWPASIRNERELDGRPCLTVNRLPQYVRQVTNEQRQNRPSVQVNPVDDDADVQTAEILEGLIRHIEYDSAADAAYDTAFFGAASCGFGYWRITTDYSGPLSFEQDIKIMRVRNPFTVYLDPNAKEPDFSDAEWGFVIESMSKDAFKAAYPDSELSKMQDWTSVGDRGEMWVEEDRCRIAEYFYRETESKSISQLSDGDVILTELVPDELPQGIKVVSKRKTEITTVKWAKINGKEILEETEWAGRWIPIVKVVGDEFDIDGELILKGIVRDAKEPQTIFNYMKSAATESIGLAPKAPFIMAEGQVEGHETEWQNANRKSYAYLTYKPTALGGNAAPAPQRNAIEPAIQAITLAMQAADSDLKNVTGIYDPSLGSQQGPEQSGKAIIARQGQTNAGNFHYLDNLTRALRHTGKILLDLIPKVYDTERVIRIIGETGDQKQVTVNQSATATPGQGGAPPTVQPGRQAQPQPGEPTQQEAQVGKIYDLSVGKYDVTISTGPSYQSRRQEAVASMTALYGQFPELAKVTMDVFLGEQDWPGAQKMAARVRTQIPPAILAADDQAGDQSDVPPAAQAQISAQAQQLEQLQQQLQQAQQDIAQKLSTEKLKVDSHERIEAGKIRLDEQRLQLEREKIQATIITAQLAAQQAAGEAEAANLYDILGKLTDNAHEAGLQAMQQGHEAGMQQMGAENAANQTGGADGSGGNDVAGGDPSDQAGVQGNNDPQGGGQ